METWQIKHIEAHLPALLQLTNGNTQVLAVLQAKGVIGSSDVEKIEAEKIRSEKTKLLYNVLKTRVNGYYALLEALASTNQTGAYKVLVHFPVEYIGRLRVEYQGKVHVLSSLLTPDEIESIQMWLTKNYSADDFLKLHETIGREEVVTLLRDTIPPRYFAYLPRHLSRLRFVDPKLFKEICPDVFVFRDTPQWHIRKLIQYQAISDSTAQLLKKKITVKFIILHQEEDWRKLCSRLSCPVHLIRYEAATDSFIVEATTGGSNVLRKFMKNEQASDVQNLSEDEFVDSVLSEDKKGYCICDAPGMGKSLLLKNVASKISIRCPERIVAFFPLQNFNPAYSWSNTDLFSAILEPISTSALTFQILIKLISKNDKTKFELFFDGLDEIHGTHLENVSAFLRQVRDKIPNARVYVTSRLVMRAKLEETLGAIAYEIQPFDEKTQHNFLINHWNRIYASLCTKKLDEYASFILKSFKDSLKENTRDIAGVPLQCWLIAEVYAEKAGVYAERGRSVSVSYLKNVENSITEIYSKFMVRQLGETKCNFACMHVEDPEEMNCDIACQVKSYYVSEALRIIFPNLAEAISPSFNGFCHLSAESILSSGIIEEINTNKEAEFMHRSFAEYLVAEYFAKFVFYKTPEHIQQLAFDCVFTPGDLDSNDVFKHLRHGSSLLLREYVVAYFLNDLITGCQEEFGCNCLAKTSPLKPKFYLSLKGCLRHDLGGLLDMFIKAVETYGKVNFIMPIQQKTNRTLVEGFWETLEPEESDLEDIEGNDFDILCGGSCSTIYQDERQAVDMLKVAAQNASLETIDKLCKLFQNTLNLDLLNMSQIMDVHSPIAIVFERADYELAVYFLERMSLENKGLLHTCFRNTYFTNDDNLETRIEIAKFLLSKCSALLTETWEDNFIVGDPKFLTSPLVADGIHMNAIKFLIEKGAPLGHSSQYFHIKGRTILYTAADYMSDKDFYQLCRYLYFECKAHDLFLIPEESRSFFGSFWFAKGIQNTRTVLRVLQIPIIKDAFAREVYHAGNNKDHQFGEDETHYKITRPLLTSKFFDRHKNNDYLKMLLYVAVIEGELEVVDRLVSYDGSFLEMKYSKLQTPILMAVDFGKLEIVKTLLAKGANVFAIDIEEQTVLHLASRSRSCQFFHEFVVLLGEHIKTTEKLDLQNGSHAVTNVPINLHQLINLQEKESLETPLHCVLKSVKDLTIEALDKFFTCGNNSMVPNTETAFINIHTVDSKGKTVLHTAIQAKQSLDVVKYLIKRGVDLSAKNTDGMNAAQMCLQQGLTKHLHYIIGLQLCALVWELNLS